MSPSLSSRLLLALVVVVGLVAASPARSARAHDSGLPFEVAFPQEVEKTTFSNTWGARRSGGRRHQGTDLMAEKMSEVYAAASGTVTHIAESGRPGRYMIIAHGDGWESYYIHLNDDTPGTDDGRADWGFTIASGIEVGSWVEAGQLIGFVGDSGNAEGSGSHTHFEFRRNGRAVNPYHALAEAAERGLAEIEEASLLAGQYSADLLML